MEPSKFDDMTKVLATSIPRRKALWRIGGTLTGAVLASLLPGRVLADGSPGTPCARLCNELFGPGTPEALQCIQDSYQGRGPCFCCFTAETLVAMADGTSRPIEHIVVGDLVLGNAGLINRVVEIERPPLGQRHLYALNESNFFVTAEHPFMTEQGWKSIDPAALAKKGSTLPVARLTVGDRLLTLAAVAVPVGGGKAISGEVIDVRIDTVALESLVGQAADPATQLYNLRLNGNHTYFANNLLVHNR